MSLNLSTIWALPSHLWDTEWTAGFNLYQQRSLRSDYIEDKLGRSVTMGHPLAPYLRGYLRYKLERTHLEFRNPEFEDRNLFRLRPLGSSSSVTTILEYDKRNDRFAPSEGAFASTSIEYSGLGGDLFYTKGTATLAFT